MTTTTFPQYVPTSRSYGAGDFPVKVYRAQDGGEVRILYGDKRVGMTLNLTYQNIEDSMSAEFLDHYHSVKGTFQQFELGDGTSAGAKKGWDGGDKHVGATYWGSKWRYSQQPTVISVYPGYSTVTVNLVAAVSV